VPSNSTVPLYSETRAVLHRNSKRNHLTVSASELFEFLTQWSPEFLVTLLFGALFLGQRSLQFACFSSNRVM
jgi:hypothetical protein